MTMAVPFQPLSIDQDDVLYEYGPDSNPQPAVVAGVTSTFEISDSRAYPGTYRKVWVHAPATCDPARPARVAVFQDGWWYLDPEGAVRGGIVLDNLTHSGALPPTIGIFVDPGHFPNETDPDARKNRNAEYDADDDRYANFLVDEVIPRVASHWMLSDSPQDWVLCGGSSGGNGAFTAAWHRPDRFGRVVAFLSSFTQMPRGNPYPELLVREPRRPIRIFLQAAHRDLGWNEPTDNWLAENLRVGAALAHAGYDFRLVLGDGGHSPNHAGVLLPDALRWIFR